MLNLLITLGYHTFYTILIILLLGYVDTSYSDTFFKLKGWKRLLFWGWIIGITVPMIYYMRDKSWIVALGCLFVIAVLFASNTRYDKDGNLLDKRIRKNRDTLHVIGATGGIAIMLAGFIFQLSNWKNWNIFNYASILMVVELIVILPIGKIKKGIKNHTFWIEFAMIVTPVIALLIDNIKQRKVKRMSKCVEISLEEFNRRKQLRDRKEVERRFDKLSDNLFSEIYKLSKD